MRSRSLIYVPVIHSEAELGSLATEVRRQFEAAFGKEEWTRRHASIDAMWDGIRGKLFALPLAWERTRLYQDGLPICGHEVDIVRDLAAQGSRNHVLLCELMERGATLMGTERAELVVADYRRTQRLVDLVQRGAPAATAAEVLAVKQEGAALLAARDEFIARHIDATLGPGETALLFLGLIHRVDEHLGQTLAVHHVIHSLPFGADLWKRLRDREAH